MITINWGTKVITVPKTDTALVQAGPPEIRELDLDVFRQSLNDLQDDEEGMSFVHTHIHLAPVILAGVTYVRVVEIVNGYTITFEDGSYAVNVVGGNSNIGDVVNRNSVGVNTANSGGLIQLTDDPWTSSLPGSYAAGTAGQLVGAVLASGQIDGLDLVEALRIGLSVLVGKSSGFAAASGPRVFRAADDSKDRVTANQDADGNRTTSTLDGS